MIKQVEEKEEDTKEEKRNSPLFILMISIMWTITLFSISTIGFRVCNIIITGSETPTEESREWLSLLFITTHFTCLLVSTPIGLLCDIYGRRIMLLFCFVTWFLRLFTLFLALLLMKASLLVISAVLHGIGIAMIWMPFVILKDILPKEKVSIWFTYMHVGYFISQAVFSGGLGLLNDPNYGNVALIYLLLFPCVIALITFVVFVFYLVESKPVDFIPAKYSWKDFICIFDVCKLMKGGNIGILFFVLFTYSWGKLTYGFDLDNFMNHHFDFNLLQSSILITIGAGVSLFLHPWGLTVNYFSDIVLVKAALICKIVAFILIAISPMVGVGNAYASVFLEAAGSVALPLLKSLLSSYGKTGETFGSAFTIRSIAGILSTLFARLWSKRMQGKSGILPSLHWIISAIFIFVGVIVFWFYKHEYKKENTRLEEEDEKKGST